MLQLIPGGFLKEVIDDTTPVLGGDLDGGGFDISNVVTGAFTDLETTSMDVAGTSDLNSSGGNFDTRIRGDGDAALIYADASADKVGIGTNAPWQKLHVMGLFVQERDGRRWHFGPGSTTDTFALSRSSIEELMFIDRRTTPTSFTINNCRLGLDCSDPKAVLDVNANIIRVRTAKTIAASGQAGEQGHICWDADYIYVCVAGSTWKRAAISTW